ncbi:MAG: hypothetical protein ACYDEP_06675 [Acidimicrobiales bacterium]
MLDVLREQADHTSQPNTRSLGRERPHKTGVVAAAVEKEVDAEEALHTPGIHSIVGSRAGARGVAAT